MWEMEAPPLPTFPRPEDRAIYEKGRRLLAAGDAKGALGPLAEASRRLPRDPVVMHDYGLALVQAGREDLGLFKLEHASRMVPGIGTYRLDLVRALLAAGRRGPAVRELEELLARDPTHLEAAELLASLPAMVPEGGVASPGLAAGSMDLGGASDGGESPRPMEGGAAFTNEDLGQRRTVTASPSPPA
jgi:tetratricopeptide (TPR) repeat protein